MAHRFMYLARFLSLIPRGVGWLIIGLGCACVPSAAAHAQSVVHEDFEDGTYSGSRTSMRVPPRIMEENGNTFLRITGSPGDKQSIPAQYPHRTRSTVTVTSSYGSMPTITSANMRQTYSYSARLRIGAHCPKGCSVFELYQGAPGGEGSYGTPNGTGPSARFKVNNGRSQFETRYRNESKIDVYDLGVSAGSWHTYTLEAVWSHSPSLGRFNIYVDGQLKRTIAGRDVNMGPATNRLSMVKFGLYGDRATGVIDIDDIHINPTGVAPAPRPGNV
jgi:hypothetical protein